jgi:hypothetical protein
LIVVGGLSTFNISVQTNRELSSLLAGVSYYYSSSGIAAAEPNALATSQTIPFEPAKNPVVVFVCNKRYGEAVASSVKSLRLDGGYDGDVAVILEEEDEFTHDTFQSLMGEEDDDDRVTIFKVQDMMDAILIDRTDDAYLHNAPPAPSCKAEHRAIRQTAYYRKSLIYHPFIAERWDMVLYIDGCMTFHNPNVNDFFSNIPAVQNRVLAAPDPWMWSKDGLNFHILECAKPSDLEELYGFVGTRNLMNATYYNSALILYDSRVVRDYTGITGDTSSTLIELLRVYHTLGQLFAGGDQCVQSVYWIYIRKLHDPLPLQMLGTNMVPYEFINRIKESPHIITNGNADRGTCTERHTNQMTVDANQPPTTEDE